jgi:hypothetical protein
MADAAVDALRAATRECAAAARLFSREQCAEAAAHASVLHAFFSRPSAAAATSGRSRGSPLLPQLPTELIVEVLHHLDVRSLCRLACTCRQLYFGPPCPPRPMSPVEAAIRRRADAAGRWTPSSLPAGVSKWVHFLLQREWRSEMELRSVAAGLDRSYFLDANGALLVCSEAQEPGLLGLRGGTSQTSITAAVPTPVPSFAGIRIRAVACRGGCNLAVSEEGQLFGWGHSESGEEKGWSEGHALEPTLVRALRDYHVCQAVVGNYHCAALTEDGALFTWEIQDDPVPGAKIRSSATAALSRPLHHHIASLRLRACASSRWQSAIISRWQ